MTRYEENKLKILNRIATSLEGIEKCLKDENRIVYVKEAQKEIVLDFDIPEKTTEPVSAAEYLKGLHVNLSDLKGV
nr:hypothetical protein [uncultured Mediterraneibacter sp.]